MADLTVTIQRSYADKHMSAHVAKAMGDMVNILSDIADEKRVDLTEVLDEVRSKPDMAGAWVLAALSCIPATPFTLANIRMASIAVQRNNPSPDEVA